MSIGSHTPAINDPYCHVCSSTSSISSNKRFSSFLCEHCHLLMCYDCYDKHKLTIKDEYLQIQKRYLELTNLFLNKKQLFTTFEAHCLRSINSTFDEIIHDLENLRTESINYVKQQFQESEIILSDMITHLKPLISQSYQQDDLSENLMNEFNNQNKQINEIEKYLEIFSSPTIKFQMSTYPRNKFDLNCELLLNPFSSTKNFSSSYPGKIITTKCTCHEQTEYENEKIDVDTEVEEFNHIIYSTKQTQTDLTIESNHNTDDDDDDDEYFSLQEDTNELTNRINTEYCLSTNYKIQSTILTQNEVDRIASNGENLLYFSDTSKSLCYITNILSDKYVNGISTTKEITCRWPHYPILDLVYSPVSLQFICATKTGVYTLTINSNDDNSIIDIQMQLTQHWSYIRLSADTNYLWIWTDTPRLSQLSIYSPKTFDCIKIFKLTDYPRFSDNSTSFCIQTNLLATVFQYKQSINTSTYKKYFHVTFCDSTDLHELSTIRLGECDIDHEIRVNNDGKFFITNGKRKLWIIDQNGKKEYVKLIRTGRALAIHKINQIIIANGTQQLQCIEFKQNV